MFVEIEGSFVESQALLQGHRLFCGDTGLFFVYRELFCGDIGLFCGDRELLCG